MGTDPDPGQHVAQRPQGSAFLLLGYEGTEDGFSLPVIKEIPGQKGAKAMAKGVGQSTLQLVRDLAQCARVFDR